MHLLLYYNFIRIALNKFPTIQTLFKNIYIYSNIIEQDVSKPARTYNYKVNIKEMLPNRLTLLVLTNLNYSGLPTLVVFFLLIKVICT